MPGGAYIPIGDWSNLPAMLMRRIGGKRVLTSLAPRYGKKDVRFLKEIVEGGQYRAVIDRCYPLERVVEATRYVETGQKTGNVVLTVTDGQAG